jgi:outer membrane lipoprotein-sorting protein
LKLALRAACALACLVAFGCRTPRGPQWGDTTVYGEDAAMQARVNSVATRAQKLQTLRAVGKLHVKSPDGSASVQEVVLVDRPAQLRLESLNMLGQASSLFVTDGQRFTFFDGKSLEEGEAKPEVLHQRLKLAFTPEEAVLALLTSPLSTDWADWTHMQILGRGEDRKAVGHKQSLEFSASGELSGISALDEHGEVRWQAEYADWRDLPGGRYPFSLVLSFPATQLRAELELSQVELNPALDPTLFRVARKATP